MDQQQLRQILDNHQLWLKSGGEQGKRADLRGADLRGEDLRGANLQQAYLQGANLLGAELQGANLQRVNLLGADLQEADLRWANLLEANLQGANLRGADLRAANLQRANLRGADLRAANSRGEKLEGATYSPEQLQVARNAPPEYLSDAKPASADVYQRRAEENQSKVIALEREKQELEAKLKAAEQDGEQSASLKQSLEAAEVELDQVRSQLEQNKQKQAIVDELAGAIEPILEAVKSDKDTVEAYKRQSQRLLVSGLLCFGLAVAFIFGKAALAWQLPPSTPTISVAQLLLQIAPGFVFAILGSALLRHDWKIRQLTLKLIDQNNSVDIAMGMLKTALRLSNIGEREKIEEIPDLVKESFAEARRALLYRNRGDASALDDTSSKDADLLQQIRGLVLKSSSSD